MNSEDRHRLETNELGVAIQSAGHWMEEHATKIVAAICGVLLVAAAVVWWSRQTDSTAVKAWSLLETAENVGDFDTVADDYKGTAAGRWAKLRASELYMKTGLELVFTNRDGAMVELNKAKEGFEALSKDNAADAPVLERANWGLALTLESLSEGDTAKAVEAYQRVVDMKPESYFKPFAEERVATLKKGGASEFYAWFSKENPKPPESRPKDVGNHPGLDDLLNPKPAKAPPLLERPIDNKAPDTPKADGDAEKPGDESTKPKPQDPAGKEGEAKEGDKPKPEDKPQAKPEKTEDKPEKDTNKKE